MSEISIPTISNTRPPLARAPTSTNLTRPLPIHRLLHKCALITGGSGKIGLETAGRLLIEGANVALLDIDRDALDAAIPILKAAIPTGVPMESRLMTIVADATKEADVREGVRRVVRRFGRVDVAVLNVGEREEAVGLLDTEVEVWERIMDVNAKSAFLFVKHVGATMKEQGSGGSIIIRSSVAGLRGTPGLISYSASKFALRGIALTAAEELGPYGIRVNTIHTSIIDAPGFKEGWSQEKLDEVKGDTVLGRFGMPDDVASVVAFLASEDSKFMTGGHLKIDGGCVSV